MLQPGWNPLAEMMLRGSMPPGTTVPPATADGGQTAGTTASPQNAEDAKKKALIDKYQNVSGFQESMADDLTTGGIAMKQLPKKRLYEFLEFLRPGMDAVTFAGLNQSELSVVVWILSGMRPNAGVHDFNCKSYIELFMRARTAMQHRANRGKIDDLFLQRLISMDDKEQKDAIMDHAIDCGFQAQWLEKGNSTRQQEKQNAG